MEPCPKYGIKNTITEDISAVGVSNDYDTSGYFNARDYLQQLNLFTTEVFIHTQ